MGAAAHGCVWGAAGCLATLKGQTLAGALSTDGREGNQMALRDKAKVIAATHPALARDLDRRMDEVIAAHADLQDTIPTVFDKLHEQLADHLGAADHIAAAVHAVERTLNVPAGRPDYGGRSHDEWVRLCHESGRTRR